MAILQAGRRRRHRDVVRDGVARRSGCDAELHRRLADISRAEGFELADLDRLTVASLAGQDALLATTAKDGTLAPTDLFFRLDARIAELRPALVVLDTLADLFPGNENDRAQARQFVGLLRGLAIRHRCAVVLLSHPSLTGMGSGTGSSGSTAWNNSVRSRLYLERIVQDGYEPDPDARLLTTKKSNYARTGAEISVRWQAGVFVAERQPENTEGSTTQAAASIKAERVFLKLLDYLTEQGRYVSSSPGPGYAPKQFAEHHDREGVTKRAFKMAMETLFSRGAIRVATHGRASKERRHIERAEVAE